MVGGGARRIAPAVILWSVAAGHHLDGDNDLHLVVPGTVATLTLYAALQVRALPSVLYDTSRRVCDAYL